MEVAATLGKFMTLKDLDFEVNLGEFVCVIGDVGSGKSSLLHAIIGDMIYVPDAELESFGGLEKTATQEEFKELKKRILDP